MNPEVSPLLMGFFKPPIKQPTYWSEQLYIEQVTVKTAVKY